MLEYITIKDIVDILLVSGILYYVYHLMKASHTLNVFIGILAIIGIWLLVSHILEMRLLGSILDKLVSVGVVALVILFQDEIRRFLVNLGSHRHWRYLLQLFIKETENEPDKPSKMPIVIACRNMSNNKTGALIVIAGDMNLSVFERTGERINAEIGTRLIENIFFKNSPLHDGAMIISNDRISSAGCILPVSHDSQLPKHLGLRHRAALGISNETDAKVIVVSEERGTISLAYKNKLYPHLTPEMLEDMLTKGDIEEGNSQA